MCNSGIPYVALTRASDILVVTYSEPNEFIDTMMKSGMVDRSGASRPPTRSVEGVPDDRQYA